MASSAADMVDTYRRYCRCMVRVTTEDEMGVAHCGAAFHVGDGWLVTARHVLQDRGPLVLDPHAARGPLEYDRVLLPADDAIDLALLHTDFDLSHFMSDMTKIHGYPQEWKVDHVQIGGHLDDWIADDWFILTPVLLMGYPPIPFSGERRLVAMQGEVNSVVDMYRPPRHPHFVISPLPRGGFSGGPVLGEGGGLLGVMVEALVSDGLPAELGYGAAISVEPLWNLLMDNGVYPASNAEFIRELEDPGSTSLSRAEETEEG